MPRDVTGFVLPGVGASSNTKDSWTSCKASNTPPEVTGFLLFCVGVLSKCSLSSFAARAVKTPPDVMGCVLPSVGVSSEFHALSPLIAFSAEMIASRTSSPRDATSIWAISLEISGIEQISFH